jgi:nitroimidazol reductase NimA-like FMN-containing flavoprotein (pyridoxamine 5'-phosphate oxidase superfamily)
MTDARPTAEEPIVGSGPALPWVLARERLAGSDTYWLSTVRPDGGPHAVPVLAVWANETLYVCAGHGTRKAKNLARDPRCAVGTSTAGVDLVLEGRAARVDDEAELRRVAEAYAEKYEWPVTVREGAFHGEGAPTAGPPPYHVYAVRPSAVFGFATDGGLISTRWRFG